MSLPICAPVSCGVDVGEGREQHILTPEVMRPGQLIGQCVRRRPANAVKEPGDVTTRTDQVIASIRRRAEDRLVIAEEIDCRYDVSGVEIETVGADRQERMAPVVRPVKCRGQPKPERAARLLQPQVYVLVPLREPSGRPAIEIADDSYL